MCRGIFRIPGLRLPAFGTNLNRRPRIKKPKYPVFCALSILVFSFLALAVVAAEIDEINLQTDTGLRPSVELPKKNPFAINSIKVQGSKTMSPETIVGILQTRTGEEVSPDVLRRIREDVKELYKLGQFSSIQVDSSGSAEGIQLTFIMEEWPKVSEITLNGNAEISNGKIKDALTIAPGRSLSGKLLYENESKIISLYKKKGYYLAQVNSEAPEDSMGTVKLAFNIHEGKKIAVDEIDIIGNRRVSDREIKKQMKIKKGKRFDDDYFDGDLKAVFDHYRQNGFLNAKIISSGKELNEDKSGLIVRIELEEGPQFRVGQTSARIQSHEKFEQLFTEKEVLAELTLEEGDIFSEAAFEESLWLVNKIYSDKGRVFVDIKSDLEYNSQEEIVNIEFIISEGGLAYIEKTIINWVSETSDEPHKTKEYVVRRELDRYDIKEGELFSYQNISDARRKIITLGPFIRGANPQPQLSIEPDPEDGSQRVTINFDIEESRQSGMFSIAGGYGSEGGVFGALDIWDENILGRAWRLHLRGEIGTRERRTGSLSFSTPWIFNTPTSLGISIYSRRRSSSGGYYPDQDEQSLYRDESVGGSITIGRPLTRQIDLSIGLRNDDVSYRELMGDTWEEIYKGKTRSIKLILDRDTRQFITSMFDPNSGTYNTFSTEYSGLGGDKFQKYLTESSIFIPTWWKLVLVFHMRTGYITGEYPTIEKLRYERFYLGGIDSIRGYDRYSIVPLGYEDKGGNQMAMLNVEYRFPITDMLRGLIFFDAGQTWADNQWPWDNFNPRKSIGIGLRIDLLGALARLEYGIPLDGSRIGEPVKNGQFQFDIGPAF